MRLIRQTWIAGCICVGLLAAPLAHALSVGRTSLNSYLMQPLDAEIKLHGTTGMTTEEIKARVGGPEEFRKLDIAWDSAPTRLKLSVEQSDAGMVIHATTQDPIQQPYLQFPLEVRAGKLKMIKEITLLLDPPGHRVHVPDSASASPAEPPRPSFAPPPPAPAQAPTTGPQTYRVRPGDTLWPIAQSLRPRNVTNYQMMIALQRANPQAFPHGNVNEIKSGSLLTVPSAEQASELGRRDARSEFRRQMQAWKSGEALTPPSQSSEAAPTRPASAREPAPAAPIQSEETAETTDQPTLEVLPPPEEPEAAPATAADRESMQRDLLLSEEQLKSQEVEQSKISQQIANLQAQMEQMQALLKLKDQQISALQSIVETRGLATQEPAATPAPTQQVAGTQAEGQPSTEGQPAAPARTSPVTLASDRLPQNRQPEVMDLFSSLPLWVWVLSGGLLALLLALVLKRRMAEGQTPSDLPLASYPEVSRPAPKPYSEHAPVTAAEPEAPEVPETPDLYEEAVSLHHGDIQAHDIGEEEDADMKALADEIDLDLPYLEEGELPELDENLLGTSHKGEEQGEEQDEIASFWDQLDIPEMQNPEEPGSGADESDQSLEILLEMARAYVELGDKDEAVGILEQALASSDDEERRARIQSVLDEIA